MELKQKGPLQLPWYINNLLISFALLLGLLLPDVFMKMFTSASRSTFDVLFILETYWLCLVLSFVKERFFIYFLFSALFVMESIQLNHVAYFGAPISPADIGKVTKELDEIIETGWAYIHDVWFVIPILIVCYGGAIFVYKFLFQKAKQIPFLMLIVACGLLSIKPIRAYRSNVIEFFYPSPTRHSLHNTLTSFSFYFVSGNKISDTEKPSYYPYQVTKNNFDTADNIILIMGESCRYDHMSLFGYHRPTTPFLDTLKHNPDFLYKPGISGGTGTAIALPIFTNLMREPGNTQLMVEKTVNLFKLAKENGYKTFWISAQESKLLYQLGDEYLDVSITSDSLVNKVQYSFKRDDILMDLIKGQTLGQKNFIILHQRNLHTPYEKQYAHRKQEFERYPVSSDNRKERTINAYDNAMLYYDATVRDIFGFFEKAFPRGQKNYLLFTSDHGEFLGEDNKYGHEIFSTMTAQVPFYIYTNGGSLESLPIINQKKYITHYDMGKVIAYLLGYTIQNPNEELDKNRGYIHGNNLFSNYDVISYQEEKDGSIHFSEPQKVSMFPSFLEKKKS